jgi:hypothetical protein
MIEVAQFDTMELYSFLGLGLDLPAALPHHSLLANGGGLLAVWLSHDQLTLM